MKKIIILTIIIFIAYLNVSAQLTKRVLFIGNSYTSVNNLPRMIYDLAMSNGDTLIFDSYTPGGYTLGNHSKDQNCNDKIRNGNWDIVVFQQQSQVLSLLDNRIENTNEWYNKLVSENFVYNSNPCIRPMIYMTWGREYGDPQFCPTNPPSCTYELMDDEIFKRTMEWANSINRFSEMSPIYVSPVGRVWRKIRINYPEIKLYQPDGSHPSLIGSYAAACTFYSVIFRRNPLSINNDYGLNTSTAKIIRTTVKETVFDSLINWNIGVWDLSDLKDFSYSFADDSTVNFSSLDFVFNALHYYWDFGDNTSSTFANPTHIYRAPGIYPVKFIVSDCYKSDTVEKSIEIKFQTEIAENKSQIDFEIIPNPVTNFLQIQTTNETDKIEIFTALGLKVLESEWKEKIDVSALPSGVYFVKVGDEIRRFIKI